MTVLAAPQSELLDREASTLAVGEVAAYLQDRSAWPADDGLSGGSV
jgi:hypothetical protein